jgi:hypothetical protein
VSPTLILGVDFRLRNREHKGVVSVGPYFGLTEQKYVTGSLGGVSLETSAEPLHTWFHFGLRVTFPS